jgi:molybdopterin synthase catalytic subunit
MEKKKPKNIFVQGPVTAAFIADSIQKHSTKTEIGAHSIFLGQVRNDVIDDKMVAAIDYTTYEEMALEHIYHSLGIVKAGEISLFVFTSSKHRKAAIEACEEVVERIKKELPVWGKEVFEDASYQWKENH